MYGEPIPGRIANPHTPTRGHFLRSHHDPSHYPIHGGLSDVVVIGGGVSGLCACWRLRRAGVEHIHLLELESQLGGTSCSGRLGGIVFPWGAHYINIPPPEADCIHVLLRDLGVIEGYDAAGRPLVPPEHLLRWPRERLHDGQAWRPELDPFHDAPTGELETFQRFEDDMLRWALYRGRDDRRAFAMPLAYSSADSAARQLDTITMGEYLRNRGWRSPRLDWLVNWACRDDYGATMDQVSAWAGIHYHACRFYDRRVADQYPADTLTWPEGNGFLVSRLADGLAACDIHEHTAAVATRQVRAGVEVTCLDLVTGRCQRLRARAAIYAGKLHGAPHVVSGMPAPQARAMGQAPYSAWLVAAIHLSARPDRPVLEASWDNVVVDSPSVGYVSARHQEGGGDTDDVLIYYLPFVRDLTRARMELRDRDQSFWAQRIAADLERVHPGIRQAIERIDIWRWGHAMPQPVPGALWGEAALLRQRPCGRVAFASCDATGLPLFEEAVFAGVRAAEQCLSWLGVEDATMLGGLPRG
ncbi:NAD(P)-binding protein [Candidatus Latescibacterota bacterium]